MSEDRMDLRAKVEVVMKQTKPGEHATIGERALWLRILHALADVLVARDDRRGLLRFLRRSGGEK